MGLDRLRLVHLNDSRSERGSRVDRHEHIAAGRIGARASGVAHAPGGSATSPYILETPGMEDGYDEVNLRRALAIAADGRPPR